MKLKFSVFALGFTVLLTQLVVLREGITGFYGNELIIGIILGNWLLLTGVGSFLGKYSKQIKNKTNLIIYLHTALAIIAPILVFLIRIIRTQVSLPGEMIGLLSSFFYSFILLLPFCVVSGFLITLFSYVFSEKSKNKAHQINRVYILESVGSLIGGFLFSLILIYFLNSFQSLIFVVILNLLAAIFLSRKKIVYAALLILITGIILFSNPQQLSTKILYPDQNIILERSSIYGSIVVTEHNNQYNFYQNSFPLFSSDNIFSNEEKIHYAMLQHENPKNILLVSGGVAGTTKEILKYNVNKIDYLELDQNIINVGKQYTKNLESNKINIQNIDARLFIKYKKNNYDVVILDFPDPDSLLMNRYYTIEFFKELKNSMKPNGIVGLSLSAGENFLSKEVTALNSVVYNTLKNVFENVLIIPGNTAYYIASDNKLDYDYIQKIKDKGIETKYIEYYISEKLESARINNFYNAVESSNRVNRDFNPVSQFYYLGFWLSMFNINYNILIIVVLFILALALYFIKIKPIPLTILVTGFSGMLLTMIIIFGFQIIYGYVYHKIGLLITSFMLGLFLGALLGNKKSRVTNRTLAKFDFVFAVYSFLLPLLFIYLAKTPNNFTSNIIFPLTTVICGLIVGVEFPIAIKAFVKKEKNPMAVLYSIDLIGACVGAIIGSVLLIPLFGIIYTAFFIALLNLGSGLYLFFGKT
ncbi:fused MFS/spermidine synthase [Candidatus Woesearchaeota archaeon]|nr:fused MFS/spermidine synthase [Candidatus Woesearchaeota archaeon]